MAKRILLCLGVCDAKQYHAKQYHAMQYHAMQYHAMQYHAMQNTPSDDIRLHKKVLDAMA